MSEAPSLVPTLSLSEAFYSIQGEGITSGVPAAFIRLRGCNLICGGPNGSLMKEGKASWWCDTEAVWRQGKLTPFSDLIAKWKDEKILDWIASGRVHLIWTGGEPTMPSHQRDIVACLRYLDTQLGNRSRLPTIKAAPSTPASQVNAGRVFNEIETNGTIPIGDELAAVLSQVNCSPKLANSGMTLQRRINPEAIERIKQLHHQFKFVISAEADVIELIRDYVDPFNLDARNVVLMPALDARESFHERTQFCVEVAKKYGFIGLTRLHISAWDKTTGV